MALWANGSVVREKYKIIGRAGAGGMATVFKAEHIQFKELRALKVMSADVARDESFVRRFTQEALLTRKLQHKNAVRVDDIDKDETGSPFIVMEFIEGRSLREAMQAGPMAVDAVVMIAKQVASALEAAHALGIVHRDIKPGNILLARTAEGECVKVVDFGIARVQSSHREDSHATLTTPGWVIGSPPYLSPEQASDSTDEEIDGRSDLYSLAVVMYQMLSGTLPLNAESTAELLHAHINVVPRPLEERCPWVPKSLSDLVMSSLSKDRNRRPKDARAFIDLLEQKTKGVPTVVKTPRPEPAHEQIQSTALPSWALLAGQFLGLLAIEITARGLAPVYEFLLGLVFMLAAQVVALAIGRRFSGKNFMAACLAAIGGMIAAAVADYGLSLVMQTIWAGLVESIDVSRATLQQVSIGVSCLLWVLVAGILRNRLVRQTG